MIVSIVSLLVLTVVLTSFLVYFDAKDLRENIESGKTTVLLYNSELDILGGFEMNLSGSYDIVPYTNKEIEQKSKLLSSGNLKSIKGNSFKVILIPIKSIEKLFGNVIVLENNSTMSRELFEKIMNSENPIDEYVEDISKKLNLGSSYDSFELLNNLDYDSIKEKLKENIELSNSEFKGTLLSLAFMKIFLYEPEKIVLEYKNKNVKIYPENFLLKLLKYVPDDYIKKQFEEIKIKLKNKAKEKINTITENIADTIKSGINDTVGNIINTSKKTESEI